MKKIRLTILLCCSVAAGFFFSYLPDKRQPRLVLLYATCSVNKDYLAPYGGSEIRYTPNLKEFADQSMVFARHQTESPFSGGGYASLFTGTSLNRHGIYYHPASLSDKNYLIAEAFRDNGYETFFWNGHMMASAKLGYAQGVSAKNVIPRGPGDEYTLSSLDDKFNSILTQLKSQPNYKAFVQVNFSMTHAPYSNNSSIAATELFCVNFPEECKDVTNEDIEQYIPIYSANHLGLQFHFDETVKSLKLTPDQTKRLSKVLEVTYKSSIGRLDRTFGNTITAIRDSGLLDKSLIVFTSDHGEIMNRKGAMVEWFHGYLEPEIIGIALMVRLPGAERGGSMYKNVSRAVDVFPSVAALSGLKLPPSVHFDGQDLSAAILGKEKPPELIAYSSAELRHPAAGRDDPNRMLVQARVADKVYRFDGSTMQVFDLSKDNWSQTDLFDPTNHDQIQIEKQLQTYRKRVIQSYKPPTDTQDWNEVRERLRSLGYLN